MATGELVSRDVIEAEPWPAYVLDAAGRIVAVNGAWDREARTAGGPTSREVIGTAWLDHIAGDEPRAWHRELLERLLAPRRRRRAFVHVCACNTPDLFRLFAARFEPIAPADEPEVEGVLVLTHQIEVAPVGERYSVAPFEERRFRQPDGVLIQCSGCRRMRAAGSSPDLWVFVPEVVAHPREDISHGICGTCREVYYGIGPGHGDPG